MPDKNNKELTQDWAKATKMFTIVSGWIVGPIILALLFGSWLDEKFQTGFFFVLTSVGIAFIITCVGIVREALGAIKKLK